MHEHRHVMLDAVHQFDTFFVSLSCKQLDHIFDHLKQVEVNQLQRELSSLNFGKVQDLVDEI